MEEVTGSNPVQCGFEYHQGHMTKIKVIVKPEAIKKIQEHIMVSKKRLIELLESEHVKKFIKEIKPEKTPL